VIDPEIFQTDFRIDGNSNYAFTLILNKADLTRRNLVESRLLEAGIEFRRGLSGGGNQLRQPYLRKLAGIQAPESVPVADHVHHYAWYVGNYPELTLDQIDHLGSVLTNI
jgi:CDP-6-deoxy-D-xylo-4-hexulose-3-dehydrase